MPPVAGSAAGMAGAGGSSGAAGMGSPDSATGGTGGFANAGVGGVCSNCPGAGGAAGMMTTPGGGGGAGGTSGTEASGTGGAMSSGDAGTVSVPELSCATGREIVALEVSDADAATPTCVLTLPESARSHAPADLSLAITTNMSGSTETLRIAQADAWKMCDLPDDNGAFYPLTLAPPTKIELCPDVCELASQEGALIELVYGCTADFSSEMP